MYNDGERPSFAQALGIGAVAAVAASEASPSLSPPRSDGALREWNSRVGVAGWGRARRGLDARSRARHTGVTRVDANTVADIWLLPPPPVGMGAGAAGNVSWFREKNPIFSPDDVEYICTYEIQLGLS